MGSQSLLELGEKSSRFLPLFRALAFTVFANSIIPLLSLSLLTNRSATCDIRMIRWADMFPPSCEPARTFGPPLRNCSGLTIRLITGTIVLATVLRT